MNLSEYVAPLKKWWKLLLIATLIAAAASFAYSLTQPPLYQVRTTLVIGNTLNAPNPNGGEFYLQQQLASIYADMASRTLVREATMKVLGLDNLPPYTAVAIPNSPMIEISVTDTNPQRTMVVANELANQLVKLSPGLQSEDAQVQQFLNEQITIVQKQIEDTRQELQDLTEQVVKLNSARQIADAQTQIGGLQSRLNQLQSTYASLLANTQRGATNTLKVIEPAALPVYPVGPNRGMIVALAALVALALSAVAAYAIEYLDDSIKSAEEIKRILKAPVIGYIGEIPHCDDPWTYIQDEPRSPVSHAFRVLRTNLYLLEGEEPIHSILVTSAGTSEGKTTVAANLSQVFAQGERKVVCIDADFHRPMLHNAAKAENKKGLSDVFLGRNTLQEVLVPWTDGKLKLIPAGELPPNPVELFASRKMDQILEVLTKSADLVVIDGPPFFLSDTSVLSMKVDLVLLVVRPGYTRRDAINAIRDQLAKIPNKRIAVVMNRVPVKESYYSKYYPYEYRSANDPKSRSNGSSGKKESSGVQPQLKSFNDTLNRWLQGIKSQGK